MPPKKWTTRGFSKQEAAGGLELEASERYVLRALAQRCDPGATPAGPCPACRVCVLDRVEPARAGDDLPRDLDAAGEVAARAFATYLACPVREAPTKLADLDDAGKERAVRLFLEALRRDGRLSDRIQAKLDGYMLKPDYRFEAVLYHTGRPQPGDPRHAPREGLAQCLLLLEAARKARQEKGKQRPAAPDAFPLIAWLDEKLRKATRAASRTIDKLVPLEQRGLGPPFGPATGVHRKAHDAAFEALQKAFAKEVTHDLKKLIEAKVPTEAVWAFLVLGGLGALASVVLAPRKLAELADPGEVSLGSIGQEFKLYPAGFGSSPIAPRLKVELAGKVHILPEYLARGHLFQRQNLQAFQVGGQAKVVLSGLAGSQYSFTVDSKGAWKVMWTLDVIKWGKALAKR